MAQSLMQLQLVLSLAVGFLLFQTSQARHANLKILGAAYGRADVTNLLNSRVTRNQDLQAYASNHVFGDSWYGVVKSLVVVYQHEGYNPRVKIVMEHHTLNINSRSPGSNTVRSPPGNTLNIVGAAYGLADVTDQIQRMVQNNRLDVAASNNVFGDTWYGVRKSLVVVYQFGNGPYSTKIVTEGYKLHIA